MSSKDWKTTVELIGILAIIASLLFVGLELRQSQRIALAAQYQARSDSGRSFFYESLDSEYRIMDAAQLVDSWVWPEGFQSDEERKWLADNTPHIKGEAAYWAVINLYGFDNYYYQYQSGLLSEEGWLALQARLQDMLNQDQFSRYQILVEGHTYRESFVELARTLIEEKE